MGHGHTHLSKEQLAEATSSKAKWILIISLLVIFGATVIGVIHYWPQESALASIRQNSGFDAAGVTYESALINQIRDQCQHASSSGNPSAPQQFTCKSMTVKLLTGPEAGQERDIDVVGPPAQSGLTQGDRVTLMRNPTQGTVLYSMSGIDRTPIVIAMGLIFVIAVLAVARWKGFWALIGLGFSILVLTTFMLPALATGDSGVMIGFIGSMAIMFVVIYVAHGFSLRSSAALMGTMLGLLISTGLGAIAVWFGRLSGYLSEEEMSLSARVPGLDFRELLVATMIVAGLGVLNDVTITQASAVWELRAAAPNLSRKEIFSAGMRIGRDHIASTIYTIVFAYAGAALSTLLLLTLFYNRPIYDLLDTEQFGGEVLRTLASATGLVLSVPITTGLSVLMIKGAHQSEYHEAHRALV